MGETSRFLLVDSRVLPEVFIKVLDAKMLLNTGKAQSVNEATRLAGISRSAFYKYKSCVHPFDEHTSGRIITLSAMLRDEAGVLSQMTAELYRSGANILTINQSVPISGVAPVSVAARIDGLNVTLDNLLLSLRKIDGVREIDVVSCE